MESTQIGELIYFLGNYYYIEGTIYLISTYNMVNTNYVGKRIIPHLWSVAKVDNFFFYKREHIHTFYINRVFCQLLYTLIVAEIAYPHDQCHITLYSIVSLLKVIYGPF